MDNTLTIRIEGDASGSQTAFTNTREQIVQLNEELDATGENAAYAGEEMQKAAQQAEYSMMEARHGIMLTAEGMGVHIPRAVAGMLASLGPVGEIFAAAFPIIAIAAILAIIGHLIAKHEELAAAERKSAEESEAFQIKQEDLVASLHRANLELEDQIRKLEGSPAKNQLAIAMGELKEKTDQLAASFDEDFQKMDKSIDSQLGMWEGLKRAVEEFWISAGAGEDTSGIVIQAAEDQKKANQAYVQSLKDVHTAEDAVRQAKIALAGTTAGTDEWNIAAGKLATTYGGLQTAFDHARNSASAAGVTNQELYDRLKDGAAAAKAGWEAMAEQIQRAGLTAQKVADEQSDAAAKLTDEVFKKNAETQRRIDEQAERDQEERIKRAIAVVQEAERLKVDATKQGTLARMAAIDAAIKDEESKGLQETDYYKALQNQKVEAAQAYADKVKETYKELEAAQDALIQSEIKLKNASQGSGTGASADAIKDRMQRGVESVRAGTEELQRLYEQDAQNKINAERQMGVQLAAQEAEAQRNLQAALASGDQGRIQAAQSALDQIIAKENEAATKIVGINAEKDRKIAELDRQRIAEQEKYENQFNSMFANSVSQILQGHESIKQAALKMYQEMTLAMIKYFIEKELKRVEDLILEKVGLASSIAAHATANAAQTPLNVAAAEASANVAAAGAGAAAGPLAPVVAAATLGEMQVFVVGAAESAEVGGVLSGGLTLTHPRESVLTPSQTENFQKMTESGSTKSITFAPEVHVHGDFNADDHMPAILNGFQSWMKANGVKL